MTQILLDIFASLGLWGVFILMAIESSFIPFPSEVVMIPAGVLAARGEYNFWIVILVGGLGCVLGAWVNYAVGMYFGKPFFLKYGKYFLFNEEKYQYAEKLFLKNAHFYTFFGRLIPAVRQLISIPAGIFGMNPIMFTALTIAGASIWNGFLVWLGYNYGETVIEKLDFYMHEVKLFLLFCFVVLLFWFFWRLVASKKAE